ncbi:MAG TPA: FAD-dependent oxidoreductase [Xanthobacteraceae bacterium]|nr:FAD-dependent oxidoreductase [Xanthobacteraceae bacterium]
MDNRSDCAVLIIGGGPCGLTLAIELGRRGISALVLDEKTSPARFPAANATQARTMEHYRRLGFAEKIRTQGLPPDYPTDIAYFTRLTKHELARFSLPSARAATEIVRTLSGSWSAAELPHRCSQMYIERVLRAEAEAEKTVSILPGWRVTALREAADGVEVESEATDGKGNRTFRARYVVGADGARSATRKALGIGYIGETSAVRDFMGGRMFAFYFRSPKLYELIPHPRAWMYWTVNRERRCFMPAINGRDEFAFHTQLAADQRAEDITESDAKAMFEAALGAPLDIEIVARSSWNAGYTLVAEKFQRGRIFIGGDAAHLFTPTGGLGYNTAVEDAVNLGWKLAAVLKGWGGPRLLDSYEPERQAIAKRNTAYARTFADSVGLFVPPPEIEDETPAGEAARKLTGDHFNHHARFEFNIPGITFGGRYDGSAIIVPDGTAPPPDAPNTYVPTACPGGRAPHLWLSDGRSLYDALGFEFTLLRLGRQAPDAAPFASAAASFGMPLTVFDLPTEEARDLYQADLALIRPDQIVAWRGNCTRDALRVLRIAGGHP